MLQKREAYKFRAIKQDGGLIEGLVYAFDQKDAFAKVLDQGYTPEFIEKTGQADRRAHERKYIECDVLFDFFGKKKARKRSPEPVLVPEKAAVYRENFYGMTQNISAGGVLFNTPQQLNIGTLISVILELPGTEQIIKSRCRVVRSYEVEQDLKYEIAASFIDLPEEARKILNSRIRQISRRFDRREYERFTEQVKLFFDYDKSLPAVLPPQAEEQPAEAESKYIGKTIDISAGGMLFESSEEVKKDQVIEVEIRFADAEKTISCLAKSVRSVRIDNSEQPVFQNAVFYLNITNDDRNWLNKYIIDYIHEP